MITRFCIFWLRIMNVPVILNVQLDEDMIVEIPRGKKLYHTVNLKNRGRLLAYQEDFWK